MQQFPILALPVHQKTIHAVSRADCFSEVVCDDALHALTFVESVPNTPCELQGSAQEPRKLHGAGDLRSETLRSRST